MSRYYKGGMALPVVMPYDEVNKYRHSQGNLRPKWPFLLEHFGRNNPLGEKKGWSNTGKSIQETNPRHPWKLEGLERYTANPRLKCDPELSIFGHIQGVFEDSERILYPVFPIAYLTRPQKQHEKITEDSRIFSAEQVEALLVMAFFCTFPFRNSDGEMPGINFNTLYEAMSWGAKRHQAAKAKMDCIWQYFASRAYEERNMGQEREIEFKRRSMTDFPAWNDSKKTLTSIDFSPRPMVDQDRPILEVDFANKVIGGGILGSGAVQEEIRMAIAPEMIVARLFTAPLEDNEVLFIKGAKRFSETSGYSNSLKFEDLFEDFEEREVVAMDARQYRDRSQQFMKKEFERELNKAFCAFYSKSGEKTKIATGHWGCGAFGGDKELKAILQLLAASEAERDIIYCMPGADFPKHFQKTVDILRTAGATIGQVFRAVDEFDPDRGSSLFAWLQRYKFHNSSQYGYQATSAISGVQQHEEKNGSSIQQNKERETKKEQEENELYQTTQTNVDEQGMSSAGGINPATGHVFDIRRHKEGQNRTGQDKKKEVGKQATHPVEKTGCMSVKEHEKSEVEQSTSTSSQKHEGLERQNMPKSEEKRKQCQPTEKCHDALNYTEEENLMTFSDSEDEQTNKKKPDETQGTGAWLLSYLWNHPNPKDV